MRTRSPSVASSLSPLHARCNRATAATHLAIAISFGLATLASAPVRAQTAAAVQAIQFDVPAGPLADALRGFARQAGVPVAFEARRLRGKTSPGLRGATTPADGLARLLSGSGYRAARTADGYVLVADDAATAANGAPSSAEVTLDAVEVTAQLQRSKAPTGTLLENVPLADTPYSINTLDEEFLRNRGTNRLEDLVRNLPGTQVEPSQSNPGPAVAVTQRGKSAPLLFDGFATPQVAYFPTEMIESLEALQGPSALDQGFFGSPGGSINLVLKRPKPQDQTRIDAGLTQYGGKSLLVDTNQVFDGGRYALRVNAGGQDLRSHLRGAQGHSSVLGFAFDFKPASGTLLQAEAFTALRQDTPQATIQLDPAANTLPRRIDPRLFLGYPYENTNTKIQSGSLQWIQDLGAGWKMKAQVRRLTGTLGGYGAGIVDFDPATGNANLYAAGYGYGTGLLAGDARQFITRGGEVKVYGSLSTGPLDHDLALGVRRDAQYYEFGYGYSAIRSNYDTPTPVNLYSGRVLYPRPDQLALTPADPNAVDAYDEFKATSLFVQDRIALGKWTAWVGLNFGAMDYYLTNEAGRAVRPGGTYADTLRKTTPSYALTWKPVDALMLYASTQQSIGVGGRAPSLVDDPIIANPDEQLPYAISRQAELGAKWNAARVLWTAALFKIDEPFEYLRDEPDGRHRLVQDGRRVNQGLSVAVQGEVAPGVRVQTGLQLLDAKITETNDPAVRGNTPGGVAERIANATVEYTLPWARAFTATASTYYTGPIWLNDTNTVRQGGHATLDLGARWDTQVHGAPVRLRAVLTNATDTYYFYNANAISVGAPRTLWLSCSVTL